MKVVLHHRFRPKPLEAAPSWLSVMVVAEDDLAGFAVAMTDAEVLLHVLEPVTAAMIDAAPRLRLIQKIGVGVNTIDLEAARAHGVAVANMPGTNAAAVAELALALMLAALRHIPFYDAAVRRQAWSEGAALAEQAGEIADRTVGLVGYGAVARRLAPVLQAMGARVLYTATRPKADAIAEWRALDDLFAESDVVSLHLPLTAETAGLVDARRLGLMRRGAVFINTARGGLVDEPALIEALRAGRVAAAGLDVFADEPLPPASPLVAMDNVVLMPHVAWLTPETWARSLEVAFDNCRRLRDGEPLLNRVD